MKVMSLLRGHGASALVCGVAFFAAAVWLHGEGEEPSRSSQDAAGPPALDGAVPPALHSDAGEWPTKCRAGRGRPPPPSAPNTALGIFHHDVPVLSAPVDPHVFYHRYLRASRPVVVRGEVSRWPAVSRWTDEYLRATVGHVEVKIERSSSQQFGHQAPRDAAWGFWSFSVSDFLDRYLLPPPVEPAATWHHWYLDTELLQPLSRDVRPPSWMPCLGTSDSPYQLFNLWMGGGQETSLLHNDLEDNLLAVVDGFKTVLLVHPNTSAAVMREDFDNEVTETKLSEVDLTGAVPDSFARHAHVSRVVLRRGDLLFIPALWWHQVRSECRHLALSMWIDSFGVRSPSAEWVWANPTARVWAELRTHPPLCPSAPPAAAPPAAR